MNRKQYNTKSLYFTPQLLNKLYGILDHPLTIVEAPMGYGKTTAVREFLSGADTDVLWLRVYDDSTDSFWNEFARLFGELKEGLYKSLVNLGIPNDSVSMREALNLMNNLSLFKKCILVVDDFHLIENPELNRFITALIENDPENLHIVLNVRFTKFNRLEELSLKGFLLHITKNDLELGPNEIIGYYGACGVPINENQARQLYSATEGWISALYLTMLEYTAKGDLEPPENIYKLIGQAIYVPLSDEMKEFMLSMSIFDSFSLKLAENIWGGKNTGKMLAYITGKNAFVNYDIKSKTYNIHSLYREYLQEALAKKNPEDRNALYQRAAQWYMSTGNHEIARQYFYLCRDFDNILCSIEQQTVKNYTTDNKNSLKKYISECPQEIVDRHPYALLVFTIHLFVHNELELFYRVCKEIEDILQRDESLAEARKKGLGGELELLYGVLAFNDLKKMSCHLNRAWDMLGSPTSIYKGLINWNMDSPSILHLYHSQSGELKNEINALIETMPVYNRLANGHGSGGEYLMEAEWYFNMGQFDNAEISLYKAINKVLAAEQSSILLCAMFLQTRLAFVRGNGNEMFALIKKMRGQIEKTSQYQALHMVEICEICLYAYLDQYLVNSGILDYRERWDNRLRFFTQSVFNIVYGRVLLVDGAYLKLIGSADQFLSDAAVIPNLLGTIYTYIYLAAAYYRIGREDEAAESLNKALDIAMPDRLYMPFAENFDFIGPVIQKIAGTHKYAVDITALVKLSDKYQSSKEKIINKYFSDEKPKLTNRETEIARLAAAGSTNKKIAEKLYISENTVKTMLRSIYAKLNIKSRALLKQYFEA